MTQTLSATPPVIARWQDGWVIPINITSDEVTGDHGTQTVWTYDRLIAQSLAADDVTRAVAAQFDSDPDVLTQAQAGALAALAPQVGLHDALIDDILIAMLEA